MYHLICNLNANQHELKKVVDTESVSDGSTLQEPWYSLECKLIFSQESLSRECRKSRQVVIAIVDDLG